MIHEEICTYELCKLAKEKGFPQYDVDFFYEWDGLRNTHSLCNYNWYRESPYPQNFSAAPTQSLLQRWLREEKNIHITISVSVNDKHCFYWTLYSNWRDCWEGVGMCHDEYDTYELALEDAIKYILENLI